MDKYEFNIKAEQMRKMTLQGDYKTAMQIADTIDWRRVRNANLLASVADIYEHNKEYQEAKDILLLAFDRAPVGKRFLFKLAEISVESGELRDAQEFYNEFCEVCPEDARQYLLRYKILKAKGAKPDQLISSLEQYTSTELDEKWLYELAALYDEAGREEECVKTCDKIMLLFGLGKYVDKAMELKLKYQPLTKQQMDQVENRDKYEAKLERVSKEYGDADAYVEKPAVTSETASVDKASSDDDSSLTERNTEEASANASDVETTSSSDVEKEPSVQEESAPEHYASREQIVDQDVQKNAPVTRIPRQIRKFNSYHMIIEAKSLEDGLRIAKDEIKYFHEKYGYQFKVAKTNAEKLNEKGFEVFIPKLRGRDLIVESAGDLKYSVVDEISDYIDAAEDASSVVLVDVVDHFDRMAEDRPLFIKKFDLVSDAEEEPEEELLEDVDLDKQESTSQEEPVREAYHAAEPAGSGDDIRMKNNTVSAPEHSENLRPEIEAASEDVTDEHFAQEDERLSEDASYALENEETEDASDYEPDMAAESEQMEENAPIETAPVDPDLPADYYKEMSMDDFATYAQSYAKQIDCVMPGKTVLALYERIELMEEDGVPLNKASAEQLIEEAADKAEKPSLGKKLAGVFHPKYDKDDKLILREENFIS